MLVPHETKKRKDTPSHAIHEILRAKREWETIFDALSVPVSFHDIDMTVLRANRAFASLSGILRPFSQCGPFL
jgi:PAS domain-containing protein